MSGGYKFRDQDELYFISFAVVNWIDLFIRNEYKEILWLHGGIASSIRASKYTAGVS